MCKSNIKTSLNQQYEGLYITHNSSFFLKIHKSISSSWITKVKSVHHKSPNPAPWIQSDLYVQGPSSGVIYSDPPPQHNFWGADSNGSDVQLSSSGRPICTRSQSSQSSCNSSHPYKIRCPTCSKAYDKYYFKNRKCGCRKPT